MRAPLASAATLLAFGLALGCGGDDASGVETGTDASAPRDAAPSGSDGSAGSPDSGSDATPDGAAGQDAAPARAIKTIFLILMENHDWSDIQGNPSAPYINDTLLKTGAHAENYFDNPDAVHPSEPNYIWLEAGDNLGITNDDDPPSNHQATTEHLVTQLSAAGISWRAYVEDISGTTCPIASTGLFAPKHTPMLFFDDVVGNPPSKTAKPCIDHIRPYGELASDLSGNKVARYNFITPNLCDDMHNSSGCATSDAVKNGDDWLAAEVPKILASQAYADGGAIFITWDESEAGEFPIGMIVLSPKAKTGYSNATKYYHSSMLRTAQEVFGVGPLLRDAANRPDLSDLFTAFP